MRVRRDSGDGWLGVLVALVKLIFTGAKFLFVKARDTIQNSNQEEASQNEVTE